MTIKRGDTIKYLRDVHQPPHQAGKTGDTKVVGQDISLYHARYLLRDPHPYVEVVPESRKSAGRSHKKAAQPENGNQEPIRVKGEG